MRNVIKPDPIRISSFRLPAAQSGQPNAAERQTDRAMASARHKKNAVDNHRRFLPSLFLSFMYLLCALDIFAVIRCFVIGFDAGALF